MRSGDLVGLKQLLFYPDKCTGCKLCSVACSTYHLGFASTEKTAIRIVREPTQGIEYPNYCIQCEEKPCMTFCPTDALVWDPKLGIVELVDDLCIGCGVCVIKCPYEAIAFWDRNIIKCNLCGGAPQCVSFCPEEAIVYKEATEEDIRERYETAESLLPLTQAHFGFGVGELKDALKKGPKRRTEPIERRQLRPSTAKALGRPKALPVHDGDGG